MLDSFPERAQAPIVSGRNLTFAAARISAASASVIQSAAAGIGVQSPPEPDEPEPDEPLESEDREESERDEPDDSEPEDDDGADDEPDPEPSPDDEEDEPDPSEPDEPDPSEPDEPEPSDPFELPDDFVPGLDPPRSFFAHPDPLKWIVGGANSFRIVPSLPHDGQNCGPGSLRPWRMSVRWSQAVQAYS
jgi:hypothetical protein